MSDRSGSDTRQRRIMLSARFNEQEAEALRQLANGAGLPVASFMRSAALNRPIRRPAGSRQDAARILGQLGKVADGLRNLEAAGIDPAHPLIAAALRDLAEMRFACLQVLGVEP